MQHRTALFWIIFPKHATLCKVHNLKGGFCMKSTTKRMLAFILALCSLVTFAMPTVFATGTEFVVPEAGESIETPETRPADLVIDFATAFANAGIVLTSEYGGHMEVGLVTWAVTIGLVAGKFIGIYLFTWLAIKCRISSLVNGMTWSNLAGISLLGGIGFTVSLFIANLSFGNEAIMLSQAKLGVLLGTVIAGVMGCIVLYFTLPKLKPETTNT